MLDEGTQVQLKHLPTKEELLTYFKAKIIEEAREVSCAESKEKIIDELADCLEVIHGFAHYLGISFDAIEEERKKKLAEKGGFAECIVVDTVSLEPDHEWTAYFLKNFETYPEKKKAAHKI